MKLQDPYTGAVIDAAESAAKCLMAHGFKKPQAEKKDKTKRKKA